MLPYLKDVRIVAMGEAFRRAGFDVMNLAANHVLDAAADVKDAGVEKAREIARDADKKVHQNPWSYIAGSAVVGVLLGYILGGSRR